MNRLDEWKAWLHTQKQRFVGGEITHVDMIEGALMGRIVDIKIEGNTLYCDVTDAATASINQRGDITAPWHNLPEEAKQFTYHISGGRLPMSPPRQLFDGRIVFACLTAHVTLSPATDGSVTPSNTQ